MILGLDISTSITGVCLMSDTGEYLMTDYIDLRKADKSFNIKAHIIRCRLELTPKIDEVTHVFIEDKLSGFSGGRTMQKIIVTLAGFNALVSYITFNITGCEPEHIHTSTIKALMAKDGLVIPKGIKGVDKKKVTCRFVRDNFKDFPYEETKKGNPKACCYDMADSWTVARSGYLKFLK